NLFWVVLWIEHLSAFVADTCFSQQLVIALLGLIDNRIGSLNMRAQQFERPGLLGFEPVDDCLALFTAQKGLASLILEPESIDASCLVGGFGLTDETRGDIQHFADSCIQIALECQLDCQATPILA